MDNYENKHEVSVEIDSKKLKRMVLRIYALERENTKTNSRSEKEMKAVIQSIIEEEVKKCY